MGIFRKHQQQQEIKPIKLECKHKYRDFPWYIEASHYVGRYGSPVARYEINIIEPYVCVFCGDRQNKVLKHIERFGSYSECEETVNSIQKIYADHIQDKVLVEDAIADLQLVDRDYLRALAIIKPEALAGMDEKARVALQKS